VVLISNIIIAQRRTRALAAARAGTYRREAGADVMAVELEAGVQHILCGSRVGAEARAFSVRLRDAGIAKEF
jgi:hypothetical protein